jgi:hypothetical protein
VAQAGFEVVSLLLLSGIKVLGLKSGIRVLGLKSHVCVTGLTILVLLHL